MKKEEGSGKTPDPFSKMSTSVERLPRMIEQAASRLAKATSAAEVLDVINLAKVAGDAAKSAIRFTKAKNAHDTICAACRKAMADALEIEMRAQCRLADEYDAAQERGEVGQRTGRPKVVPDENDIPSAADLGLSRKQVHEARKVRDAEKAKPGVVHKALTEQLEAGEEPTRAHVNRVLSGKSGKRASSKRRSNQEEIQSKGKKGPRPGRGRTEATQITPEVEAAIASEVLDGGKSLADVSREHGLQSDMVTRFAVAREQGRREAELQITPDMLSMTAQEKLTMAIRQHTKQLNLQFEQRVQSEIRRRLDESVLPQYNAKHREHERIIKARKGVMSNATFKLIWTCLHPDSRNTTTDKKLAEAFNAFESMKLLLLDEKQMPTSSDPLPRTFDELAKSRGWTVK